MLLSNAIGRSRELLRYDHVMIDVIVEGQGPAIVLLPSLARDSDDYDEVAEGLAAAGFRVLRPQPRGIGRSSGPLTGLTARFAPISPSHQGVRRRPRSGGQAP